MPWQTAYVSVCHRRLSRFLSSLGSAFSMEQCCSSLFSAWDCLCVCVPTVHGNEIFYSACDPFCTVLGMRLYSILAGHRLSPELPREASGMGAVTGGPATGEGEGPRTTAWDQPRRHRHHSAGWLLWCYVELWIPSYACENMYKFVEACPCSVFS